jgi:oligoribonuclease
MRSAKFFTFAALLLCYRLIIMSKKKLLWVDLEMTGLDEKTDHILEIAAIITDSELKTLDQRHYIVYQPETVLENMNDWCKTHHKKSGLTELIPTGLPLSEIEPVLVAWVEEHFGKKHGKDGAVLAGNSIHSDRRFIDAHMPAFANTLHYRMVDVSSFKEIFRDRYSLKYEKKNAHRAIGDLHESIAELDYYLSFVNVQSSKS